MGPFHRLKDAVEEETNFIAAKLPGKLIVWNCILSFVLFILILSFALGLSGNSSSTFTCDGPSCKIPSYVFLKNQTASCPALQGEKLLNGLAEGQSFEGLSVLLQCDHGHHPYPISVRCIRKPSLDGAEVLKWSGLPVCVEHQSVV